MPLGAFKLNSLSKYTAPVVSGPRTASVVSASTATVSSTQNKFDGASAYFPGTPNTQSLVVSNWDSSSITTQFTFECWVYFTNVAGASAELYMQGTSSTTQDYHRIYATLGGGGAFANRLYIALGTSASNAYLYQPFTWAANTWYHIAITRDSSNNIRHFVNGTLIGSAQVDSKTWCSSITNDQFSIGRFRDGSSLMPGYIDEVRISSTARYTASFTPSTTAFTNDSNTTFLMHCNGINGSTQFIDDNGATTRTARTLTANDNAKISQTQSKFGGSAAYFDGTNDYVKADNVYNFSGDFTIECWARHDNVTQDAYIFSADGAGTALPGIALYRNGSIVKVYSNYNGSWQQLGSNIQTASAATWYHYSICRKGSAWYASVDGTVVSLGTYAGSLSISNDIIIGGITWTSVTTPMNGYIDEFRVSNIARYTSNFTVQSTPFINDPSTMLLVHCNGVANATTFTDDVSIPAVVTAPFTSDSNTLFLLHFDGTNGSTTITDSGPNNKTFTRVAGSLTTSYKKFGTASYSSAYGSTGYMTYSEVISGTGDFTMEGWFYQTNRGNYVTTFGTYIGCYVDINGYPGFYSGGYKPGSVLLPLNTWTHIAYVRASSVITIYVNGQESVKYSNTTSFSTGTMGIGANGDGSYGFNTGYFDEIRYSNIARYTGPFTI